MLSPLPLFQSLVDPELSSLEILYPQYEDFRWPQAAHGQNPQYQMLTRTCLRKQRTKLINAQKTFARFLLDVRHDELSRRILLDQIFIRRVFETSFDVRANLPNRGFTITILRHFVE
jgi:hypothetical protein